MATLHEREFKIIGGFFGFSEISAKRLLSNTSVRIHDSSILNEISDSVKTNEITLRIGLHIQGGEGLERADTARLVALSEDAIRQYRRACPEVTNWMIRGDFNANLIPAELTKGKLVHACRTAGRIRAWVFQQLQRKH